MTIEDVYAKMTGIEMNRTKTFIDLVVGGETLDDLKAEMPMFRYFFNWEKVKTKEDSNT